MERIERFRLVSKPGVEAIGAELWAGGDKLADELPGTQLEAQFALGPAGAAPFLLLTTFDVPYEETVHALLVDERGALLERAELGAAYAPGVLQNVEIVSADTVRFDCQGPVQITVHAEPRGLLRRRRLQITRSSHPKG